MFLLFHRACAAKIRFSIFGVIIFEKSNNTIAADKDKSSSTFLSYKDCVVFKLVL